MELKRQFSERISNAQTELVALKNKDRALSTFRLVSALMLLACIYLSIKDASWLFAVVAIFLLFGFIAIVIQHRRLRENIDYVKRWISVNEDEIASLVGDLERFSAGDQYANTDHEFADDLDLFSPKGLYQRLNRTVTGAGAAKIAHRFMQNEMNEIPNKQDATKELASKLDFRHAFLAHGKALEEEPFLTQNINHWLALETQHHPLVKAWLLWFLTLVFPMALLYQFWFGDLTTSKILGGIFIVNLFLFSRLLKQIKAERQFVSQLSKSFEVRSKLIELIENESFESQILASIKDKLMGKSKKASMLLSDLSDNLDRLDSMDNPIGAIFLNGIMFYHLHELRKLLLWKHKNAHQISAWLEALSEFDYWISLGGYAFRNQDFNYPAINQNSDLNATNLGHPFLNSNLRVTNDLHFDGFKVVILTGSNMAGKSTFLRTIGINLILAKLGLPVCADQFETRSYQLLSSMKPQDSLAGNESYFQAEVNRLRMLVDKLNSGVKSFVLLDEILRGTNSQDKRNGTVAFLNKIKSADLLGVIATHDIEITELTAQQPETFCNKYFESKIKDGELTFDYKLRNGVCTTPNAFDLMRTKGII